MRFKFTAPFKLIPDQKNAVFKLSKGVKKGYRFQTLLGVTGCGKTADMAGIIEKVQKPTLVISHNKVLAAQLYQEFKEFFPKNSVHYFVSYYDYYQPEAYIPQTDTYIEKDAKINEEIDRLRHETVQAVLSRRDVIVVASVSCIYNIGSPSIYQKLRFILKKGQKISRRELMERLVDLQYQRNDYEFLPGRFRIRAHFIDVWPASGEKFFRIKNRQEKIEEIIEIDPFGQEKELQKVDIWPAKFWLSEKEKLNIAIANIRLELQERIEELKKQKKFLEAERLKRRTEYDLSLIQETGWCHGIENYSRHLEFREPGAPPFVLLDYFPSDFLIFIDESHMTIPQLRGMYEGDRSRKETLIEYGFRLPSCLDNRPLKFNEFLKKVNQVIFVSATPAEYERKKSVQVVEQLIRPTGLLDPTIEIKPTKNQINDAIEQIKKRIEKGQRVLVTTLTKRLAEAVAEHLKKKGIKATYFHSEIKTLTRPGILKDLRLGKYDCLVGINLLREGLDLPEVSLIVIFDADKEGFLRDKTSLIQIMGRASRHPEGHIIMYADRITSSMRAAIRETKRRRKIQEEYNKRHNIVPSPIIKEIREALVQEREEEPRGEFLKERLRRLKYQLDLAKRNLQFEKAAQIRKQISLLKNSK